LIFRVAILSFWHVHAQDYAREIETHPETEIAAIWDEDPERGREEAERCGVPFEEDLDELLTHGDLDGVVVTTPTTAHREVIPAAARAGKHVFTEKVLAPTLREAEEIVSEVEQAGVTLVVSLPRLYTGYTEAIKEALSKGMIGEVTYLHVRVSHDGALPTDENPRGWLPDRFFEPEESAGGVAIDFGAHPLYLVSHLLGMPEQVVSAYGHFTGRTVEDNSVVVLRYPKGVLGVAEASFVGAAVPFVLVAHGTEGSLLYDPDAGLRLRRAVAVRWEGVETPPDGTSPFGRWVDLSSRAEPYPENVQAALELNALSEAANLSAQKGHLVRPNSPRIDRP
jgi:1,5-anhydro-D-fructose reductase (1,5-anhydro-D-mannitol-forming)